MEIWRLLSEIQVAPTVDSEDMKHNCKERFQCFLANVLDTENIPLRFQQENLTSGDCKYELVVATGQLKLLLDSEGKYRNETVSYDGVDKD